jgi:hypothetical protein
MIKLNDIVPIDDQFIDRIVDGALTAVELRAAIGRLDREPDGWKRCAVAFLEAQSWRESFRTLEEPATTLRASRSLSLPSAARARSRRRWIHGPIAAAILAVSFAMGWMGHAARLGSGGERTPIGRPGTNLGPLATGPRSGALNDANMDLSQPTQLAAWQPSESRAVPAVNEIVRSVGRLQIGTQSDGAEVPILAGPGINEQWLRNQPPPLNEYREVVLQQQGYQVDQHRQLITTTLADGRRVTVPIDQVQIRYTGTNPL